MSPIAAAQAPSSAIMLRGIVMNLGAIGLFSLMDAVVKLAGDTYPVGQIVFFRSLAAFIPLSLYLSQAGGWALLRTQKPWAHILRSSLGLGAMATGFWAYKFLPLPDAIALEMSSPLFLTALSAPLLGERVGRRRWVAVLVGFAGVLVMTRPGLGVFDPAALLSLACALLLALALIAIARLGRSEAAGTIAFYFAVCGTVVGLCSAPFGWVMPDLRGGVILVGIGLLGGVAQLLMVMAYRVTPASALAPYQYMALIYAALLGWAIWGDVPDGFVIAGAVIVAGAGLYIIHREALQRRRTTATP